ncbi:MAG: hypothetical protein ACYC7F_02160 [Gemmatimonadaceae bacterium]
MRTADVRRNFGAVAGTPAVGAGMVQGEVPVIRRNATIIPVVLVVLAVVLGNVNAVVDAFLHPDIAYCDPEHLIVGGATAAVSAALSVLLVRYVRRLVAASDTITRLEELLSICANCKRIKAPGADPNGIDAWQSVESYIAEKTQAEFSHGICPHCMAELYPDAAREQEEGRHDR